MNKADFRALSQTIFSSRRTVGPWLCAVAVAGLCVGTMTVSGQVDRGPDEIKLAGRVWEDSLQRDAEGVFSLLRNIDRDDDASQSHALIGSVDGYLGDLRSQAQQRHETYEENIAKLEEHMAEGNLREALGDALGAHESGLASNELLALVPDIALPFQGDILNDKRVLELISKSEEAARKAEGDGRWIEAQDLFYRLNTLVDRAYEDDLTRVSRRLGLLRLYAPDRLEELMVEHLTAIGETPPPRYEHQDLDTWQKHLEGINVTMLRDAMKLAANLHLSQAGYARLLAGGYRAMETLATTHDLAAEFSGLDDDEAVDRFLKYVRQEAAYWDRQEDGGDRARTYRAIDRLLEVNADTINIPEQALIHEFGDGAIAVLDQFTDLVWPDELAMFRRQLEGSFTGVGIQIIIDDKHQLTVVTPLKGSPAHRAGIHADDRIVAVDGRSTMGITTSQAIDQITGPRGTPVTLTIKREGVEDTIDFTLKRDQIPLETVKGWQLRDDNSWDYFINPEARIGYVRLTGFVRQTVGDFDAAIADLGDDLNGLVIDLRFNPGGQLQAVIELCNRFVSQGVIVSTEGPGQRRTRVHRAMAHRTNERLKDIPVVVLINEGSASASEIMAGCLRDHERAVVIGTRSFGKGSVQQIFDDIDNRSAQLRITREHYLLPNGDMIHREPESTEWGVEPHLVVRMTPSQVKSSLEVLRDVDILPDMETGWSDEDRARRDPMKLLTENIDTQLKTAVVLLQCRLAGSVPDTALAIPGSSSPVLVQDQTSN